MSIDCWTWKFEGAGAEELNSLLDTLRGKARAIVNARKASEEARRRTGGLNEEEAALKKALLDERAKFVDQAKAAVAALADAAKINASEETLRKKIEEFIATMEELKGIVVKKQGELEEFQNRDDPVAVAALGEFSKLLEELKDTAQTKHEQKVPWQIEYHLLLTPKEEEQHAVPFYGGKVTTPDGKTVNETRCSWCTLVIQHWAIGEGDERYHCLDGAANDHCTECHDLFESARSSVANLIPKEKGEKEEAPHSDLLAMLKKAEPDIEGHWVLEHNIPTFLRFPICDSPTLAWSLHSALKVYSSRLCFGVPKYSDPSHVDFKWNTYEDTRTRSLRVAYGLRNLVSLPEGSFVGLCMSNKPEWLFTDFACVFNNFVSVGIITTWPKEEIEFVINNSNISCVVCDKAFLCRFLKLAKKCPSLKTVIYIEAGQDEDNEEEKEKEAKVEAKWKNEKGDDTNVFTFAEVEHFGESKGETEYETFSGIGLSTPPYSQDISSSVKARGPDDLVSLIYSSGTTGVPKGIMETEKRWQYQIHTALLLNPLVTVSYAPLAHGMDRGMVWVTIGNGGRVGFRSWRKDKSNFFTEIGALQPSIFVSMPPLWNELYADYEKELQQTLAEAQVGEKEDDKQETIRKELLAKYSKALGSRIQHISTGGAHISDKVLKFMKEAFSTIAATNNYGTTEVPGVSQDGAITSTIKVELRDVPQMGYTTQDKPFPRGEICLKSQIMTPGYYNNPNQTNDSFVDGWFLTGDIGMIDAEGSLHIIDRKKNLLELYVKGRSVWIPTGKVESQYTQSHWISQLYLHGDRAQDCLVAVVVPNKSQVLSWAKSEGLDLGENNEGWQLSEEAIEKIRTEILADFQRIGKQQDWEDHEVPKGVVIEATKTWSMDNGFLVGLGKINRRKVMESYQLAIDLEYNRIQEESASN